MAFKKAEKKEEFTFSIEQELGVIKTNPESGWSTEVNVVSWNGREPKIDIRSWDPEHKKMSKGITLTEEEALLVCDLIKSAID